MVLVERMVQDSSEVVLKSLPEISLLLAFEGRESQEQNHSVSSKGG